MLGTLSTDTNFDCYAIKTRWLRLPYSKVVVVLLADSLFIVAHIVFVGSVFGPCFVIPYFISL